MRRPPTLLVVAGLALAACAPRRIPGTEIRDTPDTRAIVAAIDTYRQAAERRDAAGVMALVSPSYFDGAGTADPQDDLNYEQLRKKLSADYAKLAALRLEIGVRRIDVEGDRAQAYVFYDEHYRIKTPSGEVAKQANDSQRLRLVRQDGKWLFTSGL